MKHSSALSILLLCSGILPASAQTLFTEHFDNVPALAGDGWTFTNKSNPLGFHSWGQGTTAVGFAYSGAPTSYAEDTFLATDGIGTGTISDWMITPPILVQNDDSVALWTLSSNSFIRPDRIEVRISPNGGSDVGPDENSTGDLSTLVFSVNPLLDHTSYPSVSGNGSWTRFGGRITGLGGPTSVRVAVRYYVTDGGGGGSNSSRIGVDELEVFRSASPVGIDEPALSEVALFPNPVESSLHVRIGNGVGSYRMDLFDAAGAVVMGDRISGNATVDLGAIAPGVYLCQLRDLATGAVTRQRVVKR